MTDRTNVLTVVLDKEYRVDDIVPLITAIKMMKCVIGVDVNVSNINETLAISRARADLGRKIIEVILGE